MTPTVSALYIYPVKSLSGIELDEAVVEERGLRWDRRWMIVDHENNFITQRTVPVMATIKTNVTVDGILTLSTETDNMVVPPAKDDTPRETVRVWNSIVPAIKGDSDVNEFLSDFLSFPCALVYMPDDTRRFSEPDYTGGEEITSFADDYPILLANDASLRDLNARIGESAVPMSRFRPNIVVAADDAFFEDRLGKFRLGTTVLEGVKPCTRCSVTTVDQLTGKTTGKEPLKTLASFRRGAKGVNFGENLLVRKTGTIRTGDTIDEFAERGSYPRQIATSK